MLRALRLAVAVSLIGLVGVPLGFLLATGLDLGVEGVRAVLDRPGIAEAAINTLWMGVMVSGLSVLGGGLAALVTERMAGVSRRWLRVGMLMPLLVPPFVSALSWLRAFGPGGLVDDLWGLSLPGLIGPAGVVVVLVVSTLPLAYVVVTAGLASRVEPDTERAARMSGAGPARALTSVTLPLLRPSLIGGAALTFVAAVNAFGVPAVLGIPAGFSTVTTRIYQDLALSAQPVAFARAVLMAIGLVATAVLIVGLADLLVGVGSLTRTGVPAGPNLPGRKGRGPVSLMWLYLLVATGIPFVALLLAALTRAAGLDPVPSNWTLSNFDQALSGRFGGAFVRTIFLGALAGTMVVLLGSLLTVAERKRRVPVGAGALLTFAVPGSVLAMAILLAYGRFLRDTLAIILVAYVTKFWALGHRTIAGAAGSVPADLLRAARVSGAGPLTALRTILLPILRPALAGAFMLVFLFSIHELTMSILLYGPGTDTMAVVILNLEQLGDITVTSAMAVILTLPVVAAAMGLLGRGRASVRIMGLE